MSLRSYARRRMVVLDPAPAASAGATFARNVSPGQMEEVRTQLPEKLRAIFPA